MLLVMSQSCCSDASKSMHCTLPHTNLLLNTLQITEVRLPQDSNGRPKGFGYAEFEDKESLIAALVLNNEVNVLPCITSVMLRKTMFLRKKF